MSFAGTIVPREHPPSQPGGLSAGDNFHRLTAVAFVRRDPANHRAIWSFRCECGVAIEVAASWVKSGNTKSCGCLNREKIRSSSLKHGNARGGRKTPEYLSWINMIQRCTNPLNTSYDRYGAVGISVCDRWRDSFENFLADMGPRPGPEYSIERSRGDGNYEPDNCHWATPTEQSRNRRNVIRVRLDGHEMSLSEACERLNIPRRRVYARLRLGWSAEDALKGGRR
ncbi:hypothetical protein ACQVP2_07595 [Methylobacterium aquaticum]|uniref:hypothetical protein n=1 Tax=Methylobacterium aquaticum TaxID=270351 RepID=UPI003D1723B7